MHAIATILFLNGNVEDYVSVWFTTGMFGSCYRYTIKPINGADLWPTVVANTILPPRRRRLPGRPKVNRKKCTMKKEGRHTVSKKGWIPKCGHYKQEGHNKRTSPLLNQGWLLNYNTHNHFFLITIHKHFLLMQLQMKYQQTRLWQMK